MAVTDSKHWHGGLWLLHVVLAIWSAGWVVVGARISNVAMAVACSALAGLNVYLADFYKDKFDREQQIKKRNAAHDIS